MIFALLPVYSQAQTSYVMEKNYSETAGAAVYRLCNTDNNEHLYTTNINEVITLASEHGWRLESWSKVSKSDAGVGTIYRLFEPGSGKHLYTSDNNERVQLVNKYGWIDEGVCFFAPQSGISVYRLFNPNIDPVAAHHYTDDKNEINVMLKNGWKLEGMAYYIAYSEKIVLGGNDRNTISNIINDIEKKVNDTEKDNPGNEKEGGIGSGGGAGGGAGGHWETQIDLEATKDKLEQAISDQILSERPTVYLAIDNFVMGANSFILSPTKTQVQKGTTVAKFLQDMAKNRGIGINSTIGSYGFYLNSISGLGNMAPETINVSRLPNKIKGSIPGGDSTLTRRSEDGVLSEFDYTTSSGWMYSVNGVFPNVSMGNYILKDGDVVRVSFTLVGLGADIGGGYSAGGASSGNSVFNNIQAFPDDIKDVAEGRMNVSGLVSKIKNQYN